MAANRNLQSILRKKSAKKNSSVSQENANDRPEAPEGLTKATTSPSAPQATSATVAYQANTETKTETKAPDDAQVRESVKTKVSGGIPPESNKGSAETADNEKAGAEQQAPHWQVAPSSVDFENPLVVCLAQLASLLERPISTEALKAGLPMDKDRMSPELALRSAERAGLSASIVRRASVKKILPVTLPCILLLKEGNACVLLNFKSRKEAEIMIPEGGGTKKTVTFKELDQLYSGYAIFARPEFKFDERAPDIRLKDYKAWFWGTLVKFWPIYSHVLLASILINAFAIASPLFIMNVYDRVVPNNAVETLWVLALGVIIVFGFEFLMRNMRSYFVDVAGKNADVIIASRLLEHLMSTRLDSKPPSTGAVANNLREFEALREFFTSGTLIALVDLPFIFLFVAVIWFIAGPVAIVPFSAIPLVILAGLIIQFPLRRVIERTQREASQKHALLVEAIDGMETIKATAAESRIQRAWERFVGLTADSSGKARFLSGFATTFAQTVIQLSTVLVVVYGVHLIADGDLTMGALVAATILTGRALAPLGAVAGMLTRLQQSRVALKSLDEMMKRPLERPADKNFLHRPRLNGLIEFKGVKFAYPGQEVNALESISLKIEPGERVGVLGRIGSGKSTLTRLIMGLYDPAEGGVLMDGTDIRQIDRADLRRNVAYVSQDNYLFYGSVKDNIAFGAPQVDDETIIRAASLAGVTDFLRTHPHGFDLQVGERGMALSGGQRQSVAIARALLLDPPIILLDEPTSHMDNSSEAQFKARLNTIVSGKTLVLVTHRSSLLSLVDRLIIVDRGRVVADGPKEEVLEALRKGQVRAIGE